MPIAPPDVYDTTLLCWSAFGSPALLAAYFATLRHNTAPESFDVWIFAVAGGAIICASHTLYALFAQRWTELLLETKNRGIGSLLAWTATVCHRGTLVLLDLSAVFLLSQTISRKRHALGHTPSEVMYIPAILTALMTYPVATARVRKTEADSSQGKDTADKQKVEEKFQIATHHANWVMAAATAPFSLACFTGLLVAFQPSPENPDKSRTINPFFQIILWLVLTAVYSVPSRGVLPFQGQRRSPNAGSVALSAFLRTATLTFALLMLTVPRGSSSHDLPQTHSSLLTAEVFHDFYALRVKTNEAPTEHVQDNGTSDASNTHPPMLALPPRAWLGLFARTAFLASACRWFADVWDLFQWGADKITKIDRCLHEADINELQLAWATALCITALYSVSTGHDYRSSDPLSGKTTPDQSHSVEMLWGVLVLCIGIVSIGFVTKARMDMGLARHPTKNE